MMQPLTVAMDLTCQIHLDLLHFGVKIALTYRAIQISAAFQNANLLYVLSDIDHHPIRSARNTPREFPAAVLFKSLSRYRDSS